MRMSVSTELDAPADKVWESLGTVEVFQHITRGVLTFGPLPGSTLPDRWPEQGGEVAVRLKLFGVIPGWRHELKFVERNHQTREMLTHESGGFISRWDHLIQVSDTDDDRTFYTDQVDIGAGLLTPFVWAFAWVFYRIRQARWRVLARTL